MKSKLITTLVALMLPLAVFAQSEQFIEPNKWTKEVCKAKLMALGNMVRAKEAGVSIDEYMARNLIPDYFSVEMRIETAHTVANVWAMDSKTVREWAAKMAVECLKGNYE